jgi:hypothetical protein
MRAQQPDHDVAGAKPDAVLEVPADQLDAFDRALVAWLAELLDDPDPGPAGVG